MRQSQHQVTLAFILEDPDLFSRARNSEGAQIQAVSLVRDTVTRKGGGQKRSLKSLGLERSRAGPRLTQALLEASVPCLSPGRPQPKPPCAINTAAHMLQRHGVPSARRDR